jgi:hypothetical protein
MKKLTSRRTAVAAAAVIAVAGGTSAAIAAAGGDSLSPGSFLADVAKHLGISTEKLQDATKAAALDQVDAALKAGRITQQQADALKSRIESGDIPPFFGGPLLGPRPFPGAGPFGPGLGKLGGGLSTAATYLGLTEAQLFDKLRTGDTLADVAKAQGKTVDGLEQAIVNGAEKRLDSLVSDGSLTSDQADRILDDLKSHVDDLVNGTLREHEGDRRFFRPFGGTAPLGPRSTDPPSPAPGIDL